MPHSVVLIHLVYLFTFFRELLANLVLPIRQLSVEANISCDRLLIEVPVVVTPLISLSSLMQFLLHPIHFPSLSFLVLIWLDDMRKGSDRTSNGLS